MRSRSDQMKHTGDNAVSVHLVADYDTCERGLRPPDNNQSDSESGCDRSRSSSTGSGEAERTEEEQTYIKFVNSVFFDDDACSGYSNPSDEDEDENYEPDCKEGNDDDEDDDDDDDDDDLVRVQNRELRELVDGCWQTIAGEVPNVLSLSAATSEENRCLKHASIPIESEHDGAIVDCDAVRFNDNRESEQQPPRWSVDSTTVVDLTDKDDSTGQCSEDSSNCNNNNNNNYRLKTKHSVIPGIGQSAISHLVTKMFSDSEPVDVCVDGNPVQAVRQLVARQLSMATQLLIQVLLQADDRSDSFTKAYTSLVELSNLRDAALRKATLVQMNVDNARTIKSNMAAPISEGDMKSSAYSYCDDEEGDDDCDQQPDSLAVGIIRPPSHSSSSSGGPTDEVMSISAPHLERRLTRSSLGLTRGQRPSHSVLDVPALSRIAQLFVLIDQSRRNIKHQQLQLQLQTLADPNTCVIQKSYSLSAIQQEVVSVVPQIELRLWTCLLPSESYPLPHSLFASIDPGSLTGRCLFTPAEDDLLLRGASCAVDTQSCQQAAAMHSNSSSSSSSRWDNVRARLLPNKEAQLLQFRYSQMVSLSSATIEENNFRKFIRYEAEYSAMRDSKWTHAEELDLLRGFQLFGEKWPLIKMFFLPHRKTHQIRIRWQGLQKIWHKAYLGQSGPTSSSSSSRSTYGTEDLSPDLASFLREVNRSMLAKPSSSLSSSSSSTQPPDPHLQSRDHHQTTSARDSADSGPGCSSEETPATVGDDAHNGSTSTGASYNFGSYYYMTDDGCYPTSISDDGCYPSNVISLPISSTPANNLTSSTSEGLQMLYAVGDDNNLESVAATRIGGDVALSELNLSEPLLLKDLSGPLLLKDVPSNRYAKEKKQHKAYQKDVMKVITVAAAAAARDVAAESASSSGDDDSWPTEGVPELEAASIDAHNHHKQQQQQQQQQGEEEEDLVGAVRSPDGVAVRVCGDEAAAHSSFAAADSGSDSHQVLGQLMGDSDSLMSLLNGVDCLESMLRSCSEQCLNDTPVVGNADDHAVTTTSSGQQHTMSEMPSSSPPKSLGGNSIYSLTVATVPETGSTHSIDCSDRPLPLPSPEGDGMVRRALEPSPQQQQQQQRIKKKKTIKPTRIAASLDELRCHMSASFAENSPVSQRISAAVQWGSSPQPTAAAVGSRSVEEHEHDSAVTSSGSGGGDAGTALQLIMPVPLIATAADSKVVSADHNSSCGWSLLDDASFLQREGSMWIDNYSEWTRFQQHQAAASRNDQSSEDPHLLLLHDISALEAPEGVVASMAIGDQQLLEDEEEVSLSRNLSDNDDNDDDDASLLFGAFMPDDLMASQSCCFSNISKFVGFLKPDSAVHAMAMVGNIDVDVEDNHRRARVDIEEQLLPQQKRQKKLQQQQQQLGIFAAVMASSKTSSSSSRSVS